MARPHKIQIIERDGKIYARITYSVNGKRKAIWRAGSTRTEARDRLADELRRREALGMSGRFGPNSKFSSVDYDEQIAKDDPAYAAKHQGILEWYLARYAVAPVYSDDQKIAGMRSGDTVRHQAKKLRGYFGERTIGSIRHSDLELYKRERLATPTNRASDEKGNPIGVRSVASVHRELALLRRVFNICEREGWIARSPFRSGESLISQAKERKGTRVLSKDEEAKLIAAAVDHLKPVIICALDTGMRRGEVLSLTWSDVDLENRRITLKAMNTKTLKGRTVPISARLYTSLIELREHAASESVFGLKEVKRSFATACKNAGLERGSNGVSFRTLRRTAATRWMQAGLPRESVSKLLGHSTALVTYQHYLAADETTIKAAEEIVNRINQTEPQEPSDQSERQNASRARKKR